MFAARGRPAGATLAALGQRHARGTPQLEEFTAGRHAEPYGARLSGFLSDLVGIADRDGRLAEPGSTAGGARDRTRARSPGGVMSFYETLIRGTELEQKRLMELPNLVRAFRGDVSLDGYVAFLTQAYHHVRHTVPLLLRVKAALPQSYAWLAEAAARYVEEERGHEQWILADIAACGGDPEAVSRGEPDPPCELMVAYAYDVVQCRNPVGFFGMVHVLEGTSVRAAGRAACAIQAALELPDEAFTYLTSHGELDVGHVDFFRSLMDRIEDPDDQRFLIHCAKRFFQLYGDVLAAIPLGEGGRP